MCVSPELNTTRLRYVRRRGGGDGGEEIGKRDEELEGEVALRTWHPGCHLMELMYLNPSVSSLHCCGDGRPASPGTGLPTGAPASCAHSSGVPRADTSQTKGPRL